MYLAATAAQLAAIATLGLPADNNIRYYTADNLDGWTVEYSAAEEYVAPASVWSEHGPRTHTDLQLVEDNGADIAELLEHMTNLMRSDAPADGSIIEVTVDPALLQQVSVLRVA